MRAPPSLLFIPLALVLSACGGNGGSAQPPRPAMVVQGVAADVAVETFAGEVRARREPALAFQVGGRIASRSAEVGDAVRKGQVLAELDPEDLGLQVDAAAAQVAAAEADLALARAERDRYQALVEQQVVSRSLFETRDNAFQAAEARLRQTRAQLAVARNQAGYARLTAPADGRIAQRLAEVGQVVGAGQAVFLLATDGEREVAISLPEQRVERFRPGLPVKVELWSHPGEQLDGEVREIAPAADPASRTYAARIALRDTRIEADLGQSARVHVAFNGRPALALPLSAIHAEDGAPFVWVVDPESLRTRKRMVELGPYGEERVPVLSGIEPGDWVVAAGVHLVREDQPVRPVDRDNRPVVLADAR